MIKRLLSMTLLLSAAPVLAQTQRADRPAAAKSNSGRIICERIEETGSRLASKRICMTAEQWAERRRGDREALESAQAKTYQPGN